MRCAPRDYAGDVFQARCRARFGTARTRRALMRWPFYAASIAVLLLITYVPAFSLWLTSLFR